VAVFQSPKKGGNRLLKELRASHLALLSASPWLVQKRKTDEGVPVRAKDLRKKFGGKSKEGQEKLTSPEGRPVIFWT